MTARIFRAKQLGYFGPCGICPVQLPLESIYRLVGTKEWELRESPQSPLRHWSLDLDLKLSMIPMSPTRIALEMRVSRNGGTPNSWMVYNGKSYSNGWFWGTPMLDLLGNPYIERFLPDGSIGKVPDLTVATEEASLSSSSFTWEWSVMTGFHERWEGRFTVFMWVCQKIWYPPKKYVFAKRKKDDHS